MRSRLAMLAFCAIFACLPVSAAAARTVAEFNLEGSNGYTAFFEFSGRTASVDAIDIPSPLVLVSATYLAKGSFEGDRIRARFGGRGRVAVEFRPSGKATRRLPPRRCEGEPRVTQPGVFAGTIRFQGEGGYTSVERSRARGEVRILPRWKCRRGKRARGTRLSRMSALDRVSTRRLVPFGLDPEAEKFTVLSAQADDGRVSFSTTASRPRGRSGETLFAASRFEPRPSLRIVRFAFAHGTDETFSFDEALSTATAAPPRPFDGTAEFARELGGGGGSWLGPLTVDFPGAADVPLAGDGFRARLFRSDLFGSGRRVSVGSGE